MQAYQISQVKKRRSMHYTLYYYIYYGIKGGEKLRKKSGYRILDFREKSIIITSTNQTDIIPVSSSKHFYNNTDGSLESLQRYDPDEFLLSEDEDSAFYIMYKRPPDGKRLGCLKSKRDYIRRESFFVGRRIDFLTKDSLYPEHIEVQKINDRIQAFCSEY